MTTETKSNNLIAEVLKEVPKEALKQWSLKLFTVGVLGIGAILFGYKSIGQIFPRAFPNITVYARLAGRVVPGEIIELYPPSLRKAVSQAGEVEWEVPFEQIASSTLELQRFSTNAQGRSTREILVKFPVKDKPVVAFMLE